jgi:hypothetical protein
MHSRRLATASRSPRLPSIDLDLGLVAGGFSLEACVAPAMVAGETGMALGAFGGAAIGGPVGFVGGGFGGLAVGAGAAILANPACYSSDASDAPAAETYDDGYEAGYEE